jgi:DNA-binding response OmpR family regulator
MSGLTGRKILLAEDDPIHARLLKQAFQKAGAAIDVVNDGATARQHLARGGYDAFVTDWMMPEVDGIELARELKRSGSAPYVVLVSALTIPDAKSHALQAGANEFFAKPLVAAKLVDALAAALSSRAAPRAGPAPTVAHAAPPPVPAADSVDHPIGRTPAWNAMPETVRQVAGELLQVKTTVAPVPKASADATLRYVLPLVDSEHQLEMHVRVESSKESAIDLARLMLGEGQDDDATLHDLIAEVANVAAGSLKTAFLRDGFAFTLGLASKSQAQGPSPYGIAKAIAIRADRVVLFVTVGVQPRNAQRVPSGRLTEGMVLAESLYTSAGALVLPSGTRLTSTVTGRLHKMFADRAILVCMPDVAG